MFTVRRFMATLAATVIATITLLPTAPAGAITNGELDGNGHPHVGLLVAQDAEGEPLWRCSGTLVSSSLLLTAGHCTVSPAAHMEIWFDSDVESGIPENGYPFDGDVGGTPYTHPSYNPNAWDNNDLGVVVLDEPVKLNKYGALPALDQLDALKPGKHTTFTTVGYGVQRVKPAPDEDVLVRMVAHPYLLQINGGIVGDFALLLSGNNSSGGACFGDSGGPSFVRDTNVIAGVNSFVQNGTCGGTFGVYRVDRADDLGWLYGTFGAHLG